MGELIKNDGGHDEADELVWALFGVRVEICESEGSMRAALEAREHDLVERLASVIDPKAHADLPHAMRAPAPSIF